MTNIKNKKPRDTRTHDQKLNALRDAFERLKIRANATGSINDCSIIKVCKQADVNDTYLHTHKLKNDDKTNKKYHKVKEDIIDFRKKFSESTAESEISLAIKAKEIMKVERDKAQIQYKESLKQIFGLKSLLKQKDDKLEAQNHLTVDIAHNNLQRATTNTQTATFTEVKIVSPDNHLYKNGKYSFHDKNIKDAAWRTSRHEFEELLKRPLATRVYILVGAPCSGKTYWSKESNYFKDRHPIVIDATNLTKSDRSSWFSSIYKYKHQNDIKVCAVLFDTPYTALMERNNKRPPDKRLDDETLQDKFNKLEVVDVYEDFDEIMVVRHG